MSKNTTKISGRSIKTKVGVTTVITVSVVLVVISWGLFASFHSTLRDAIIKQQYSMLGEISSQMEKRIQLAQQQLMIIGADITPQTLLNKELIADVLRDASPSQTIFDAGFLIIGLDGKVIAEDTGYPDLISRDLKNRDYVTEPLKSGKPYISEPFRLVVSPYTPLIAFTQPIKDDKERLICLLVGYHSLNGGQFLTSLSADRLGSKGYLYIISGRTILIHPDSSRILEVVYKGKNRGLDRALSGFEGSLDNLNSRGERLLSSFKHIGGTNWVVSANTPYYEAFGAMDSLIIKGGIIVLCGILFASVIIWYVTRHITKPIQQLISHIEKTGDSSKLLEPLLIGTGDELQQLAEAYDAAIGDIAAARQSLKEEKEFFGSIIQNSATPMFILDKNHKIVFWNSALAKMTGRSSFQMVATKLQWQPFYKEKREVMADLIIDNALHSQVDLLYKQNANSSYTPGAMRAEGWYEINGKKLYLTFEAAPIKNSKQEIIAAVETLEDITERRLLEESLSRLTVAVEQSPAIIVMTDCDGNINYVNPKFCQTTGYSYDEAIGKNPRILKSGEMDASGYAELWSALKSGHEWHGEFHNKRKNGSLYWEQASISPLYDKNGNNTGYLAVKEDITARKKADVELALSRIELEKSHAELEKAYIEIKEAQMQIFQQEKLASIGQLAAGVAHEINNPMGFINSNLGSLDKYVSRITEYLQLIDDECKGGSSNLSSDIAGARKKLKIDRILDDAHQLILESQDGANRVRRIVQDLKSFSRVDQAERALVNINEALETTVNIAWNEIKYVATLEKELGEIPEILCYPQQLNQVFLNLLVNAAHAMGDKQGVITLKTWSDSENVFVSVSDTGCGISEENLQKIFEPFFTTKEVGKGTGLGLSISFDIVKKHGGEITVHTEVGVGTTFTVRLPIEAKIEE